jgi:hypothetical protein
MIKSEKLPNALYALQGVLIRARTMASNSSVGLLDLLDYAEMLPRFIASEADETDKFREYLFEIAEQYNCMFVLERFDDLVPPKW